VRWLVTSNWKAKRVWQSTVRILPRVKDRVHAISFVKDASYPEVQAVDMIAYEARPVMVTFYQHDGISVISGQ
jgi:hypothetical protein